MLSTNVVDQLFIPVGSYFDAANLPSLIDIFDGDDDDDDNGEEDNEGGDNDVKIEEKERNESEQRGEVVESEIDKTCSSSMNYVEGKKKSMFGRFRHKVGWKSWKSGMSTKKKRQQVYPRRLHTKTIKVQDDNGGIEVRLDAA